MIKQASPTQQDNGWFYQSTKKRGEIPFFSVYIYQSYWMYILNSLMFHEQSINSSKYKQGMVAQPDFRLNSKKNNNEILHSQPRRLFTLY